MRRCLLILIAALAIVGCKNLKDQQIEAYVGDSQTKIFYKNLNDATDKIPADRRVFFRTQEQAIDAGYSSAQEAGASKAAGGDE